MKKFLPVKNILMLGVALIFLGGCATESVRPKGRSQRKGTDSVSSREAARYKEIEALFKENRFDGMAGKIAAFRKDYPHSTFLPSADNLHGLMLLSNRRPLEAVPHFERALSENSGGSSFAQYLLYNLATAQFEGGLIDEAQATAAKIEMQALDKQNRFKAYVLKANIYEKKSIPLETVRQILTAGRLVSEFPSPEDRKYLDSFLERGFGKISDLSSVEKLCGEFEDSVLMDSLLFGLGSQEIVVGNTGKGEVHLRTLMSRFPQSPYYSRASELLAGVAEKTMVDGAAIGILLPMKGKFAKYGAKSLQGIELALGVFGPGKDTKVTLVVENSGEEPEQAMSALDRLVYKHHVIAVIGPMLTKGVDQISQRAQELGVPLISLARRASPPMDFVFQAGLTQQLQTDALVRYATENLNTKAFAMIYQDDKFGTEMGQSFWDAVEAHGGKIVGAETYHEGDTDFRQSVDKLSGLYYTDARQRELDLLAKERETNNIKKKTRKTEQYFNLKPVVDYQAVFIPDEPRVAGQILPTFAYRDVENVKFLGTSSWNSSEFLNRVQSYAENAIFVEAFFPDSNSPKIKGFIETYRNTFSQEPTSLEALAYDAGLILKYALNKSNKPSRSELKDRLMAIQNLAGVTGNISYKSGQFYRDLRMIAVKNGRFVEIQ